MTLYLLKVHLQTFLSIPITEKWQNLSCESILLGVQVKAVPLEAWSGPEGSRKLRFPDFVATAQNGGKVVSLTHSPPLPPENTPGTHFCQRLNRPQGHSAIGRIMSLQNSNDTIGNRTRDLPVCSVGPYPLRHRAPRIKS